MVFSKESKDKSLSVAQARLADGYSKRAIAARKVQIAESNLRKAQEAVNPAKSQLMVLAELRTAYVRSGQLANESFTTLDRTISDKLLESQNKRNKKTDEWKEKLKKANEELRKSQQAVTALQKAQENLVQSATFGGAVDALSKLTTQASGAQRGTGEREGLQRLLTTGFNKFQQFDPMNLTGQGQQKIEVTITTDEAGIITPVVKSQQLNDQVVTVVTKTINQQARVNDR